MPHDRLSGLSTNGHDNNSSKVNNKNSCKVGVDTSINRTKTPSPQRKPSIGLGIVLDKMNRDRKRKYSTCATRTESYEPPTSAEFILNIDSGTPQDTTIFPFSRRIIPLPSPTCTDEQPPTFAKHDIVSPLMPSTSDMGPLSSISGLNTISQQPSILSLSSLSSSSLSSSTSATTSQSTSPTPPPPPLPSQQVSSTIPVLSLSPSFPSQPLQRMPNLSELPMLGDMDDDHFQDPGSLTLPRLMTNDIDATMLREQQSLLSPAFRSYDESSLMGKTVWKFRIKKLLGVGAFSKVYLATTVDRENKPSAIKMIGKAKMLKDLRLKSSIEREVAVLQFLHHPDIIQLEATMEIEHHLCLVLEYIDGGELFEFVQQQRMFCSAGQVDEALIKDLFLQLISVVQWIHEQNVVHRDLKLENILLYRRNGHLRLKITDFGLARVIDPLHPSLTTRCGSEEYAAPEIWQGVGYDGRLTDTWACGVIFYAMLVGYLPFSARDGNSMSQLCYQIMQATVRWPKSHTVSDQAKQVAESLLNRHPDKRLALTDAPSMPWFHGFDH